MNTTAYPKALRVDKKTNLTTGLRRIDRKKKRREVFALNKGAGSATRKARKTAKVAHQDNLTSIAKWVEEQKAAKAAAVPATDTTVVAQ